MNEPSPRRPLPRDPKTLLMVGLWGFFVTAGAYLLSFGSVPLFVGLLLAFGLIIRIGARRIAIRRGQRPPGRWWE